MLLEELLAPFGVTKFLQQIWCQEFLHVPGGEDKFAGLFSWVDLNNILHRQRLKPPRLLLFHGGRAVDSKVFLRFDEGTKDFVIQPQAFLAALESGATLVVNHADEMCEALSRAIGELEHGLQMRIHANLYASWRRENGFRLHWDDTDTFILQIAGQKRWTVYGETTPSPIREGMPTVVPTGEPVWDGIVKAGSLLYVPRGWWHLVRPTDIPSLHLTITLQKGTGYLFFKWITERLKGEELLRKDLPYHSSKEATAEYVRQLASLVSCSVTADLLEAFLNDAVTENRHEQAFKLPNLG